MKAGLKTHLFLGIVGASVFLMNLIVLLRGQGDLIDILEAVIFAILSADGFISYVRMKGKTQLHFIS